MPLINNIYYIGVRCMTRWSGVRVAIVKADNVVSIKEPNLPFFFGQYGLEGLNVIKDTKCN